MAAPSIEHNLAHFTLRGPARSPQRVALSGREAGGRTVRVTYAELEDQANRIAAWLRARGLGIGSRIVVLVPMSIAFYAIVMGATQVGASCVFLDPWSGREQLDAACAMARPDAFFGVPRAHLLRLVSPAFRAIPHHVRVGPGFWGRPFRRMLERTAPDPAIAPVTPDHVASIAYTTGSTGRPKPVRRTHGHVIEMLAHLDARRAMRPDDVQMAPWPVMLFDPLCHGRGAVIPDFPPGRIAEADPGVLIEQMREGGVTVLTGPPALYESLLAHLEPSGALLPLRLAFVGGSLVSRVLLQRIQDRLPPGAQAAAAYGSTEVEPIAVLTAEEARDVPDVDGVCVGTVHPDLDLRLVRRHEGPIVLGEAGWSGWEVAPGERGEIVVAGPHVSIDYADDPVAFAENKIREPGGRVWHRTGDTGHLDTAGRLHLTGRLSAIVQTVGGPLFPFPVERRFREVVGVRDACLVGYESRAWVVVEPEDGVDPQALLARLEPLRAELGLDALAWHPRMPRDLRHNSKVELARLREWLSRRPS